MDLESEKPLTQMELGSSGMTMGLVERSLFETPYVIERPARQSIPFVYSSPHSGRFYPERFLALSKLDALSIRRSEDSFVDELFGTVPALGAPLLHARFPRAYLDANREPYELDQAMFVEPLPPHVNTRSLRVAGGLGTIARVVADSAEIYRFPLTYAEAERRIRGLYMPFHAALKDLLKETVEQFGLAILIDCHSMPSIAGPGDNDRGASRADIVLGDRYGSSCAPELIAAIQDVLTRLGYRVGRNTPYAGGFNTEHYGQPRQGLHAVQIEINRSLYMNEKRVERGPGFARLRQDLAAMAAELGAMDWPLLSSKTGGRNKKSGEDRQTRQSTRRT